MKRIIAVINTASKAEQEAAQENFHKITSVKYFSLKGGGQRRTFKGLSIIEQNKNFVQFRGAKNADGQLLQAARRFETLWSDFCVFS